jgi:hypothetical protein
MHASGPDLSFAQREPESHDKLNRVRPVSHETRSAAEAFLLSPGGTTARRLSAFSGTTALSVALGAPKGGRRSSAEVMIESMRRREQRESTLCLPNSLRLNRWDAIVAGALAFTAIVTIYEISFLPPAIDGLFFFNRLVDFIFLTDIIVCTRTPYFDEERAVMVIDLSKIRYRYLRGWFPLDLASSMPWDLLGLMLTSADRVGTVRLLKVAKLMKLGKRADTRGRHPLAVSLHHNT